MSTDNISVSGPVRIESDSRFRVAFELMDLISSIEDQEKDREYWLSLFAQCVRATHGVSIEKIMK